MRKLLFFILTAAILLGGAVGEAIASSQKQWTILQNAISSTGNQLGDIDIYGYYAGSDDTVFIECDTSTQKPTGRVFRMKSREEKWTDETVIDYGEGVMEDWSRIKKIEPITINVLAPNVINRVNYKFDSGDPQKTAYGPVYWRGSSGAYLTPDSDPNYWLIVAEVNNPNSWAVKTNLKVVINGWRSGFSGGNKSLGFQRDDVLLKANETKYILINKGKEDYILGDRVDWRSATSQEAWSLADFNTGVTENLDPQHPLTLKPNKGYYKLYGGSGLPVGEDLSGGISFSYYVDCYPDKRSSEWVFVGSVLLTPNGWEARPGEGSKNPDLAKNQVEAYFKSKPYGDVPYTKNNRIVRDGLVFWDCRPNGNSADIGSGPNNRVFDIKGPVIVDYSHGKDYNLNAKVINMREERGYVDWCDLIPVLRYKPIFLELYDFIDDGDGVGRLERKVVPGYQVHASTIKRPYFEMSERLIGYNISRAGTDRYGRDSYDITLQREITISSINDNSGDTIKFKNAIICTPNEMYGIRDLASRLSAKNYSPSYSTRGDTPTSFNLGDLTLTTGKNVILSKNITTTFTVTEEIDKSFREDDIRRAMDNYIIPNYLNWTGEMIFFNGELEISGPDVLSYNLAIGRYEKKRNDYNYYNIGLATGKWLDPLSYFNGSDGFCLRASDRVWADLQGSKSLSANVEGRDNSSVYNKFWPTLEWNSRDSSYRTSLDYYYYFN